MQKQVNMFEIFNILFIYPLTNLLVVFYKMFLFLHLPFALGFSIIALTACIKLALYPLMSAQIKSSSKMQKLGPLLSEIKAKYKDNKVKQQEATMKLYKEHNINPASGCLPLLIQFPVLISLYQVLTRIVSANSPQAIEKINSTLYSPLLHIDKTWDIGFFGISLAGSPSKLFASMPLVIAVPIVTAVFQFLLSKMMVPAGAVKNVKKKDDFQSAIQTQSLYIFPVMIAYFSFSLPFGLSLYWNTFTLFGILQQYLLAGAGSLEPLLRRIKQNEKGN